MTRGKKDDDSQIDLVRWCTRTPTPMRDEFVSYKVIIVKYMKINYEIKC
jgi:hypothetical protein